MEMLVADVLTERAVYRSLNMEGEGESSIVQRRGGIVAGIPPSLG